MLWLNLLSENTKGMKILHSMINLVVHVLRMYFGSGCHKMAIIESKSMRCPNVPSTLPVIGLSPSPLHSMSKVSPEKILITLGMFLEGWLHIQRDLSSY